jgi:hypothetical protein
MRRLRALLVAVALMMAGLSAVPASAVTVSKVDLVSARLVAGGLAVDVTFKVRCSGFENQPAGFNLTAYVDQRIGRTVVSRQGGAPTSLDCRASGNQVTVRVTSGDVTFRPKLATIKAQIMACDNSDCVEPTSVWQVRLSTVGRPEPSSIAFGDEIALRLVSARVVQKGAAVDVTYDVTCRDQGYDSCRYPVLAVSVRQRIHQGLVGGGYAEKSYQSDPNHRVTIRVPALKPLKKFRPEISLISGQIEACWALGCPTALSSDVVRLKKRA